MNSEGALFWVEMAESMPSSFIGWRLGLRWWLDCCQGLETSDSMTDSMSYSSFCSLAFTDFFSFAFAGLLESKAWCGFGFGFLLDIVKLIDVTYVDYKQKKNLMNNND